MSVEPYNTYSKPHPVIYLAYRKKHKKRTIKKTISIFLVLIFVFSGILLIYSAGFIPVTALLETRAPAGDSSLIGINEFTKYYPKISDLTILDKIKYSIYGTDESCEVVEKQYTASLEKDGYKFEYSGSEKIDGFDINSYGHVKGLTAVGIIMISGTKGLFGYDTIVFYSTGNALDYKLLIDEYGSLSELIF